MRGRDLAADFPVRAWHPTDKKVPGHLFFSTASLTGDKTDIYNATVDGEDAR
jgi:hypothetical protein